MRKRILIYCVANNYAYFSGSNNPLSLNNLFQSQNL